MTDIKSTFDAIQGNIAFFTTTQNNLTHRTKPLYLSMKQNSEQFSRHHKEHLVNAP